MARRPDGHNLSCGAMLSIEIGTKSSFRPQRYIKSANLARISLHIKKMSADNWDITSGQIKSLSSSLNHDSFSVNDVDARDCRFAVEPHAVECVPNTIVNCRL